MTVEQFQLLLTFLALVGIAGPLLIVFFVSLFLILWQQKQ